MTDNNYIEQQIEYLESISKTAGRDFFSLNEYSENRNDLDKYKCLKAQAQLIARCIKDLDK